MKRRIALAGVAAAGFVIAAGSLVADRDERRVMPNFVVEGPVVAKVDRPAESLWVLVIDLDGENGDAVVARDLFDTVRVGDRVRLRCVPGQLCEVAA